MKKSSLLLIILALLQVAHAQKPRPDAFAPEDDTLAPKVINMAASIDQMDSWDRYPTYGVYVEMMERFAESYPTLCHLDTIGTSVQGRLILSLAIDGAAHEGSPQFFYSSTMHGDEVTGFYLMLRLCDSLLSSYGSSTPITNLLDSTKVYINPLSNPDGTYRSGDNSINGAMRYNANYVDLNRNYPDPFGSEPLNELQPENEAMIAYVSAHQFALSANLHGGSEVMNYPWDSYTSAQLRNEHADWWDDVCRRFVDTCRRYDSQRFRDVNTAGVINGGDWYVISNGRQDYFNYYHGIRELTMELSTTKKLSSDQLCHYWDCQSHALINYIHEIHSFATISDTTIVDTIPNDTTQTESIFSSKTDSYKVYPNPTQGPITVVTPTKAYRYDLSDRRAGIHVIFVDNHPVKVIKL